jgi:hypothetical protein
LPALLARRVRIPLALRLLHVGGWIEVTINNCKLFLKGINKDILKRAIQKMVDEDFGWLIMGFAYLEGMLAIIFVNIYYPLFLTSNIYYSMTYVTLWFCIFIIGFDYQLKQKTGSGIKYSYRIVWCFMIFVYVNAKFKLIFIK